MKETSHKKVKDAIVIGAGIGGIATAIRLAVKNYAVNVFEANNYPGGKLSAIAQDGFRFDAGPSLFTLPNLVDELFLLAGKKPAEHFKYKRLETICHYFYEDGTRINAPKDRALFAQEIEKNTDESADKVLAFLKNSEKVYNITAPVFLEKSLHKAATYFNKTTAKSMLHLSSIKAFESMNSQNEKYFSDPRIIQLFNRFATYNGSNPYVAPATLNVIPHLEHHLGAYYPEDGMYAITQSLFELATSLGVQFHFGQKVDKILIKNKKTIGVKIGNNVEKSDLVVSNMDVFFTYKNLLADQTQPHKILRQEKSSSGLIFYWGVNTQTPQTGLHNIFFSKDYQAEFDHIFTKKTMYHDPTVYLNISSKLSAEHAPTGCENWFILLNAPHLTDAQNWTQLIAEAKENVLAKLSRLLDLDVAPLIQTEAVLDPRSIQSKTASHLGALYGTSSNDRMAAFARHPNFSKKIKGLYFVGGSVHPGGGIPLSLLSAKIVGEMVV